MKLPNIPRWIIALAAVLLLAAVLPLSGGCDGFRLPGPVDPDGPPPGDNAAGLQLLGTLEQVADELGDELLLAAEGENNLTACYAGVALKSLSVSSSDLVGLGAGSFAGFPEVDIDATRCQALGAPSDPVDLPFWASLLVHTATASGDIAVSQTREKSCVEDRAAYLWGEAFMRRAKLLTPAIKHALATGEAKIHVPAVPLNPAVCS